MPVRLRKGAVARVLAIAAVVLSLALLLHAASETVAGDHDHAAHGVVAGCVLLFALAISAGIAAPPALMLPAEGSTRVVAMRVPVVRPRSSSRASPSWLQRFLR